MFFQFLFLYLCGSQECPSEKHKDDFKVPVRDVEVAGSNPVYPINANSRIFKILNLLHSYLK